MGIKCGRSRDTVASMLVSAESLDPLCIVEKTRHRLRCRARPHTE